ncbi:hypothetical protein Dimus_005737, partial [Dionaea muscipula]
MEGPSTDPVPLAIVHPTATSRVPLTFEMNVPPQALTTDVPLVPPSNKNITPPSCDVESDKTLNATLRRDVMRLIEEAESLKSSHERMR